jgi:FtsH-binding integral membrane protein
MDKNYLNTLSSTNINSEESSFQMKVMTYTGLALLSTALSSFFLPALLPQSFFLGGAYMLIYILEILLVFTSSWWSQFSRPLNFILYFSFAVLSGLTLYPLLVYSLQVGGVEVLFKALIVTVLLSFSAGIYAKTTHRNLISMGSYLMIALIGLIIVGILQIFWPSDLIGLISSALGVILFTVFIAYDIQIINNYPKNRAIEASLALYLSIFNLFISVLRLLVYLNRD